MELLAELIMGGDIRTRKGHEPVQVFGESFYICTVLSTLSHIKHRQHEQNKIKINQVITWSRSRNSNSPGYWHCFRIGPWCIWKGTNWSRYLLLNGHLDAIKGSLKVLCSLGRIFRSHSIDAPNRGASQHTHSPANRSVPI